MSSIMKSVSLAVALLWIVLFVGDSTIDKISGQIISGKKGNVKKTTLTLGVIIPYIPLERKSKYSKIIQEAFNSHDKDHPGFYGKYQLGVHEIVSWTSSPSPQDILDCLCSKFLPKNVSTLVFIFTGDIYGGRSISSAQYFFQLAAYLGLPVISWYPENSALEQVSDGLTVQLAPSIKHQASAMLGLLRRYGWTRFSLVKTQLAGHDKFSECILDFMSTTSDFKYIILSEVTIKKANVSGIVEQLRTLTSTETRIVLMYCTCEEAALIFEAASLLKMTGKLHVWILAQSILGNVREVHLQRFFDKFPVGTLGIHFETNKTEKVKQELITATKVFANAVSLFGESNQARDLELSPSLSCFGHGEPKWAKGNQFYRYMTNVSLMRENDKPVSFEADGSVTSAELEILNLDEDHKWTKIGSWLNNQLTINEITWPGGSRIPPAGLPDKFHVHVTFLEEPLFVNIEPADLVTGNCTNRGVRCRTMSKNKGKANESQEEIFQCCSGLCIDLLQMLAKDLKFTYELNRVEDGLWGSEVNGSWNGLIAELTKQKTDLVLTALKINSERENVVDFSAPFMQTGIAIAVAKRTGIISPKAFLDPFDTTSWLLIGVVGIQFAALSIFAFEWLSPVGYDRKIDPPADRRFSLCRTYWLVWAMLFGAAVEVDCPRGYTARFMANVWAMFAVVFLAIYTAKLTAVMITREEFFQLSGINDHRLQFPNRGAVPLRFGTIPFGNTEAILKRNYPHMYKYMTNHNRPTVVKGVEAVKQGMLDAFIYDAVVLDYLASQDEQCRLLTVGSWYAMTGYGIAFPRKSKYYSLFNDRLLQYKENGELERLQKFWMAGSCKSKMETKLSITPLSLDQFMSAFVLLGCGLLLATVLFASEFCYCFICRKRLARKPRAVEVSALFSLGLRRMITSRGSGNKNKTPIGNSTNKRGGCADLRCEDYLVKTTADLHAAAKRIKELEQELKKVQEFCDPVPGNTPIYLLQTDLPWASSMGYDGICYQPVSQVEDFDRADYETAL